MELNEDNAQKVVDVLNKIIYGNPNPMTKKEFKELCSIHVYGHGERRRVALFFDWKSGKQSDGSYYAGFSQMIKGYGCTQAQILKDAYNILIKNNYSELCWYDSKTATNNNERFKVPICG